MNPIFRKLTSLLAIIFCLLILGIPIILWFGSNRVLRPKRRPLEDRHLLVNTNPAEYGINLQAFNAPTHDGHTLKGYLVHPEKSPGEAKITRRMWNRLKKAGIERSHDARGTVILMHGRGGLKENMLSIAQRFVAADFRCVVYDARAHGESEGNYCTYGKLEKQDASAVLDHIDEILTARGEAIEPVVAFGNSLGAAVMLQTIPEDPRIIAGVAAAPFAEMREVVTHVIGNATSHQIPVPLRSLFVEIACLRAGFWPEEVAPELHARDISVPVFVTHGRLDEVIPINHAKRIFRNLPEKYRKWQEIPDAYHYNILAEGGDDLYETMIHFYLDAIKLRNRQPISS